MSISSECGLMIGLPYDDLVEQTAIDEEKLRDMIGNEDVSFSSIYYDSGYEDNIIGFWVTPTHRYQELDFLVVSRESAKRSDEFEQLFGVKPKLYQALLII